MDALPDHLLQQCVGRLSTPDQAIARCVCRRFRDLISVSFSFDLRAHCHRLEPWLCVLGGIQEDKGELVAEMFDFRSEKWRSMPALPPNSFNFSCAVVGCNLYAVGGFVGLSDIATKMPVYNLRTNTWHEANQMYDLREACGCGVIGERIYVAGGICRLKAAEQRVRSAEVYYPDKNLWHPIASMSEGRSYCASAVVGNKLYIIGGYGVRNNILQSVEVYDPVDGTWTRRSNMPRLWILAGCASIGSKIYLIGSDMVAMDEQELAVYDTKSDVWSLVGSIPFGKLVTGSKCSLWGCAVASAGGKLYVMGGASSYDGGGLNSVLVYEPDVETWTTIRQMKSRRHACAAIVVYR